MVARLSITANDKVGLKEFSDETLEKFNLFDIHLKKRLRMRYVDIIDYDHGSVRILYAL